MHRKDNLLKFIVENYIERAEPVGSKFLVENSDLEVSGATIRNEMNALEKDGLLTHPHTSAGRIPTLAGLKYYIDNLMKPEKIKNNFGEEINETLRQAQGEKEIKNERDRIKILAKHISELVGNAVLVAFEKNSLYYTGLSNLFSQPEFRNHAHTVSMSVMFDQCEERIDDLYELIDGETKILIGEENPLGTFCGLVGIKVGNNLITILGPIRMDYSRSVGLLDYISNLEI